MSGSSDPVEVPEWAGDESASDSVEDLPQAKKLKAAHPMKEPTIVSYNPVGLSDCTLRTESTIFKTHKAVLSIHSTFFSKLFASKFKEANSGDVNLPEDDSISIGIILRYCYDKDVGIHELATQLFPSPDDSEEDVFFGSSDDSQYCPGNADDADAFEFDEVYTATRFSAERDLDADENKNRYTRRFKGLLKLMRLSDKFGITKLSNTARHDFGVTAHRLTRPVVAAWLVEHVFNSKEEPSYQESLRRCLATTCGSKWLNGRFLNSPRYRQVVTSYPVLASMVLETRQAFCTWHFMTVKCSEETCLSGQLSWSFHTSIPYWTSSIRCAFCAKQSMNFSMDDLERPCAAVLTTMRCKCRHCLATFYVRARTFKTMQSKHCIHCGTTHIEKMDGDGDEDEGEDEDEH